MSVQSTIQSKRNSNGKIGELLVELELTQKGWHVERLDGTSRAVNADIVALKGKNTAIIQVKTNGSEKGIANLGYASGYLEYDRPFFNGKGALIEAQFVVCVTDILGDYKKARFFVFTVEEAEKLCAEDADQWHKTPTKLGKKRSSNFPISPRVERLSEFENAWEKLSKSQFRVV